jgi:hypothetical protein
MSVEQRKNFWVIEGLIWGLFMFVIMGLIFPFLTGEDNGLREIALYLLVWLLGGLAYGYTMHWFRKRSSSKS